MPDIIRKNPRRLILKRAALCLLALIFMSGAVTESADGYVLDGRHILEFMLEHLDLPGQMRIKQTLTVFDERFESGRMAINQTVCYKIPGKFRSEIKTGDRHRIYLAAGDETLTIVDGKIASQTSEALCHYKDLFCYRPRESLADRLRCLGMNVSISSYARWEEKVAYVIGARYPNKSMPQLWVEKSSFLPMRWIYQPGDPAAGRERIEFRYEDWQQTGDSWYPRVIEIFKAEGLIRRIDVNTIEINPVFLDDFFNIDHLKAVYSAPVPESEQPESENDIDRQIKQFREIFEPE